MVNGEIYHILFENALNDVANHKNILNQEVRSVAYRFLDVNTELEKLTDLKKEHILNKNGTKVLLAIKRKDSDNIMDVC